MSLPESCLAADLTTMDLALGLAQFHHHFPDDDDDDDNVL
jgi:hypothetical protein